MDTYGDVNKLKRFNIKELETASRDTTDNSFKEIAKTHHKAVDLVPINVPTTDQQHEENLKVQSMSFEFNQMVDKLFADWVVKKKVPIRRFKKMLSSKNKTIKDDVPYKRKTGAPSQSRKRQRI